MVNTKLISEIVGTKNKIRECVNLYKTGFDNSIPDTEFEKQHGITHATTMSQATHNIEECIMNGDINKAIKILNMLFNRFESVIQKYSTSFYAFETYYTNIKNSLKRIEDMSNETK